MENSPSVTDTEAELARSRGRVRAFALERASADTDDQLRLRQAIGADDTAQIHALLQSRPALAHYEDAVALAAASHPGVLRALLDAGLPANARGPFGKPAVAVAAEASTDAALTCLELLLEAGASPVAESAEGLSPLHYAATRGRPEAVELLIDAGSPVDARGVIGLTPLHLAAAHLHAGNARTLLARGAEPNARDHAGSTPLHQLAAADVGLRTVDEQLAPTLEALVEGGADLTLRAPEPAATAEPVGKMKPPRTPLELARMRRNRAARRTAELLEAVGRAQNR